MDRLVISGFKCFLDAEFGLNKVTVLTGNNGSGKSSVIQSILLLREGVEEGAGEHGKNVPLALNGYKMLQLGAFDDICNDNVGEIVIGMNGTAFNIAQADTDDVEMGLRDGLLQNLPHWLTREEFYYLDAERIGPRRDSEIKPMAFTHTGVRGEYAGNVLWEASQSFPKISPDRCLGNETNNFTIQVDRWMSYIFGDVSIKTEKNLDSCRIKLRGSRATTLATNTGFGYTYALPIVIDGLNAEKDSLLIVENPEAHLHPKAQSNIGFFLGKIAAAGVKIIIETHSEHVVNGIRRAALSDFGLDVEDVTIYFFNGQNAGCSYEMITVDRDGNLSDFPVDFFDQVRQDMMEIIRLASSGKK